MGEPITWIVGISGLLIGGALNYALMTAQFVRRESCDKIRMDCKDHRCAVHEALRQQMAELGAKLDRLADQYDADSKYRTAVIRLAERNGVTI